MSFSDGAVASPQPFQVVLTPAQNSSDVGLKGLWPVRVATFDLHQSCSLVEEHAHPSADDSANRRNKE